MRVEVQRLLTKVVFGHCTSNDAVTRLKIQSYVSHERHDLKVLTKHSV